MSSVQQPSPASPSSTGYSKAIMASLVGAAATLIVVIYNQYAPHPLPAEGVAALQTIATSASVLFTPHNLFGGAS